MAEIIFSCPCGMILKVRDDDQAGSEITCPSCQSSVTVPSPGQARIAPREQRWVAPESTEADAPRGGHGALLTGAYLIGVVVVTLGLVKFLLLPAMNRPQAAPVETVVADLEPEDEPVPKKPKKTAKKKPRKPVRKDAEPVESKPDLELPEYKADAAPTVSVVTEAEAPVVSRTPDEPVSAKKEDLPGFTGVEVPTEPATPKAPPAPVLNDKSPYAHIANPEARKSLEYALMNTRHVKATYTAEIFLKSAEKVAGGDPVILNEVKKLRDKIDAMRRRSR